MQCILDGCGLEGAEENFMPDIFGLQDEYGICRECAQGFVSVMLDALEEVGAPRLDENKKYLFAAEQNTETREYTIIISCDDEEKGESLNIMAAWFAVGKIVYIGNVKVHFEFPDDDTVYSI